ncbi:MAG: thioredoxin TrxC [Desulfovibrio sp.]|nr:MAG: thioredoxin TrxC [Desulfovibrio sp.]
MSTLFTVCPHCRAVNRIDRTKVLQGPTCGKCKTKLLEPKPVALDTKSFDAMLAKNDLPLVVDFWAEWCGPCKMMAPAFEQAAKNLHPDAVLAKVNTEQEQDLAARYSIRSIPTMALFYRGKERARVSGAMDASALTKWVRKHLPTPP